MSSEPAPVSRPCYACGGTGMGHGAGGRCLWCGGSGVLQVWRPTGGTDGNAAGWSVWEYGTRG